MINIKSPLTPLFQRGETKEGFFAKEGKLKIPTEKSVEP
jgi:hypothetical protein